MPKVTTKVLVTSHVPKDAQRTERETSSSKKRMTVTDDRRSWMRRQAHCPQNKLCSSGTWEQNGVGSLLKTKFPLLGAIQLLKESLRPL